MVSRKTKPNDTKKHSRISNSMRRGKMLDRRPDAETRERERERQERSKEGWKPIGCSGRAETARYIGTISRWHVATCRTDCNLRANVVRALHAATYTCTPVISWIPWIHRVVASCTNVVKNGGGGQARFRLRFHGFAALHRAKLGLRKDRGNLSIRE